MTNYTVHLLWGITYGGATGGVSHRELARRLGVAVFSEGYTNPQRLQIIQGTLAYNPDDPQALNFQSIFSTSPDGSTRDYLIGFGLLTTTWWARFQARIPSFNGSLRYAKMTSTDGDSFPVTETNVPALSRYVGTVQEPSFLVAEAGLVPYSGSYFLGQ